MMPKQLFIMYITLRCITMIRYYCITHCWRSPGCQVWQEKWLKYFIIFHTEVSAEGDTQLCQMCDWSTQNKTGTKITSISLDCPECFPMSLSFKHWLRSYSGKKTTMKISSVSDYRAIFWNLDKICQVVTGWGCCQEQISICVVKGTETSMENKRKKTPICSHCGVRTRKND